MSTVPQSGLIEPRPNNHLELVYPQIAALKPDPRNPRQHSRRQIKQLAQSIETFGFIAPALVDGENNVIAGHCRILACRELGWSEIPAIRIENLSEAKRRALMIADNRLAENASWDERLLSEQLRDLSLAELDFDIEVIGFDMGEIDLKIAGLDGEPAAEDPADEIPEGATTSTVSKPGDLWLLGDHRVLCGNALDIPNLDTLMGGERAAMAFTDPPYNVPIEGHVTGLGKIHHRSFAMAAGEMSSPSFTVFLARGLRNQAGFCMAGSLLYVCMDWRHIGELLAASREADAELQNLCVWVKDNGGMGPLYRSQHELVFVFKTGGGPHRNNVQLGRFIVLDGFLGSGTTLIAAERTGRRGFGIEFEPAYVDTIIRRWQKLTGNTAQHAENGRTFDDLASEAEVADAA